MAGAGARCRLSAVDCTDWSVYIPAMKRTDTRARIIDAAERVVLDRGVGALTLDAVAEASGLSKGGLIYHFPSKEALITAMVARLIETVEARIAASQAQDREPGAWTRGYVAATLPECAAGNDAVAVLGAALLAAVAADGSLLGPIQERQPEWIARQNADGIDPVIASIVRLAADGLWMNDVFGVEVLRPDQRREVIARLIGLTRPCVTVQRAPACGSRDERREGGLES